MIMFYSFPGSEDDRGSVNTTEETVFRNLMQHYNSIIHSYQSEFASVKVETYKIDVLSSSPQICA